MSQIVLVTSENLCTRVRRQNVVQVACSARWGAPGCRAGSWSFIVPTCLSPWPWQRLRKQREPAPPGLQPPWATPSQCTLIMFETEKQSCVRGGWGRFVAYLGARAVVTGNLKTEVFAASRLLHLCQARAFLQSSLWNALYIVSCS